MRDFFPYLTPKSQNNVNVRRGIVVHFNLNHPTPNPNRYHLLSVVLMFHSGKHFGLGDIWKHKPLCDSYTIKCKTRNWELLKLLVD
jgi:hypothetical protein